MSTRRHTLRIGPHPRTAPAWLETWRRGLLRPDLYTAYDETEHYAIVRSAGRHHHSGQGQPWRYAPTIYLLIRKGATHDQCAGQELHRGQLTQAGMATMAAALRATEQP